MTTTEKLLSLAAELRLPPSGGRITAIIAEISTLIPRGTSAYYALLDFFDGKISSYELSIVITSYAYKSL